MNAISPKRYRNVLRLLGIVATIVYISFIVSEFTSGYGGTTWEAITTGLLMIVFLAGFIYLFKNEFLAGILWVVWYFILLLLVKFVWVMAGITVIMGLPIFVLGILVLIYGVKHRKGLRIKD